MTWLSDDGLTGYITSFFGHCPHGFWLVSHRRPSTNLELRMRIDRYDHQSVLLEGKVNSIYLLY